MSGDLILLRRRGDAVQVLQDDGPGGRDHAPAPTWRHEASPPRPAIRAGRQHPAATPYGRRAQFSARVPRLGAALALCAGAGVVVRLGGPPWLCLLVIGSFMLAAPGLLLLDLLGVRDGLLGLVLSMLAGPVLWVIVSTAEVFSGIWEPGRTVLVVAALLGLTSVGLVLGLARPETSVEMSRHRFRSHRDDEAVVEPAWGRHRGAFPPPGSRIQTGASRREN